MTAIVWSRTPEAFRGGLFANRTEAIRFAMYECQHRLNPSLCCPMVLSSTARSPKTLRAIRRSGARRKETPRKAEAALRASEETSEPSRRRDRSAPAGGVRRWRLCRPTRTTREACWRYSAYDTSGRERPPPPRRRGRVSYREHGKACRSRGRPPLCDEPGMAHARARSAPFDHAGRGGNADGFMAPPGRPPSLARPTGDAAKTLTLGLRGLVRSRELEPPLRLKN